MTSMWPLPDRETKELIALSYAKWLGGFDNPEALRQAQLREREVVHRCSGKDLPVYWGAFSSADESVPQFVLRGTGLYRVCASVLSK
jgi:CHAT domain-containing protein